MSSPAEELTPLEDIYPGPSPEEREKNAVSPSEHYNETRALKRWKPVYDEVILLHVAGYKNIEIADLVNLTPVRVSQIITSPKAQKAVGQLQTRQFKRIRQNIESKLELLGEEAIENIGQTVQADFDPGSSEKKHQDDVSFDVLALLGYTKKKETGDRGGIRLSPEASDRIASAIEESDQVKRMWEAAEDGEAEVIEEEET